MEAGNSLEAIFDRVELHQSHIFFIGIAEYLNSLDFAILAKDFIESVLLTDIFFERTDMESVRRRVDGERSVRCESK